MVFRTLYHKQLRVHRGCLNLILGKTKVWRMPLLVAHIIVLRLKSRLDHSPADTDPHCPREQSVSFIIKDRGPKQHHRYLYRNGLILNKLGLPFIRWITVCLVLSLSSWSGYTKQTRYARTYGQSCSLHPKGTLPRRVSSIPFLSDINEGRFGYGLGLSARLGRLWCCVT